MLDSEFDEVGADVMRKNKLMQDLQISKTK